MKVIKIKQKVLALTGAVICATFLVTSCGTIHAKSTDASQLSCDKVSHAVSNAQSSLKQAQDKAANSEAGTPAAQDAKSEVAQQQAALDALTARQKVCGQAADGSNAEPDAATIAALTVQTVSTDCAKTDVTMVKNVVKFDVGARKGTPPRKWSDALSTPLSGATAQDKVAAVQAAICEDPLYGSTVANMFANLRVGSVSVGSLNPWLSSFKETSQINDQAASYIPLLDKTNPTTDQVASAVKKNVEWQSVAARLGTLVSRFQVAGVQTLTSVRNWHLVAGGLKVGGLPEVSLDSHQDRRPALALKLTQKNACAPLALIGFNVGDKRPEVFKVSSCAKPHTTTPSTSRTTVPYTSTTTAPPRTTTSTTTPPRTTTTTRTRTTTTTTTTTTPPTKTTTKPPVTCESKYGPGYHGTYPNCKKDGSASVQPTQPPSATGTNPAPVPVTKSNTVQPTASKCYDPNTGDPVPAGTPGAWCS